MTVVLRNSDQFFGHFQANYAHYSDERIILPAQHLEEDAQLPLISRGSKDTIVFLYTGGTIGSKRSKGGYYAPTKIGSFKEFAKLHPDLAIQMGELKKRFPHTKFEFRSISPMDSGAMNDAKRVNIVRGNVAVVKEFGPKLLSIINLHGTDSCVETAALVDNVFSDGSILINFASSQYAPGVLGGDGSINVVDGIRLSHCNISGTYITAAGTVYHPADCEKASDSNRYIYGDKRYGFGKAGEMDAAGGVKMFTQFTARGWNPGDLPRVPEDVLKNLRALDLKKRFLVVSTELAAWQITDYAKDIRNGKIRPDAVFVEARGTSSVTTEASLVAVAAAIKGIPVVVPSIVPQSSGKIHYEVSSGLARPGIFLVPSLTSTIYRKYGAMVAAAYTRYFMEKLGVNPKSMGVDPDRLRTFSGKKVTSEFALFSGIYTRGQRGGIEYTNNPILPNAGFNRLVQSMSVNRRPQ